MTTPKSSDHDGTGIVSLIKQRLKSSPYWTDKAKDTGRWINNLQCPACSKPEAFTHSDHPFSLFCHRNNECGATTKINSLFPDLFADIEKQYAPTEDDPRRPATFYLSTRGINTALNGLIYEYFPDVRGSGSGAVMFPLPSMNGKVSYNGRLFSPPAGQGKTHNQGSTTGLYWSHPGMKYDHDREVFVTEGIVDALSLIEMGHQAIAVLASGQDPARVVLTQFPKLVFAFDNDPAGHKALKNWTRVYNTAKAIMPPPGGDWNDWLLGKRRAHFTDARPKLEWHAKLALADTAQKYVETWYEQLQAVPGLFEFSGGYWWSFKKKDDDDFGIIVVPVSNFTLTVDHYQLDNSNPDEPSNRYHLRVKPRVGRPVFCSAAAPDLYTPHSLKRFFIDRARVHWEAHAKASEALLKTITEAKVPVVRQLYTTGYDQNTECYFFKDFMVDASGATNWIGKDGFFKINNNTFVRPASIPTLRPAQDSVSPKDIYELIFKAWGNNGITALSWVVASWFVRQIKAKIGFFPFLSLYGDTQTGKSILTHLLNAMQCIDEEGLPMSKANTSKGEIRKLAQRSGLFTAMLEWPPSGKKARFDLDQILTMYNDAPLQVRAIKTNDLQTHEISFHGALAFVQNNEPFETKAQKERIISLEFKDNDLTVETNKALTELTTISLPVFSQMFQFIMSHRREIESKWYEVYKRARILISNECVDARVRDNHAIVLAFFSFLSKVFAHSHDLLPFVKGIGKKKHRNCCHIPETIADLFIELVMKIRSNDQGNNIATEYIDYREDDDMVYINVAEALKAIKDFGFVGINIRDLYNELKAHPAFVQNKVDHRFSGRSLKAWKFNGKKLLGENESNEG